MIISTYKCFKMNRFVLLLAGLMVTINSHGQVLKIQGGTSISKLTYTLKGITADPLFEETYVGACFFAGMDYVNKPYFNLSTNVGWINKGGKDEFPVVNEIGELTGETRTVTPTLDYLSVNTTFNLKYPVKEKFVPFLCLGPRFDYLVKSSKEFKLLKDIDELRNHAFGLIFGGGLNYQLSRFQVGLRGDYYLDFTKVADWTDATTGYGVAVDLKTITVNLMLGYRLH